MLKKSTLLSTLLLMATRGLPSQAHVSNGLPSSSHASNITWTGRIDESGTLRSFTGPSLQHIEAQIREIAPDFSWSRTVEPRARENGNAPGANILCYVPWEIDFASVYHITEGIAYLRKIQGNCTNGPGPANCSRVSCSYSSGIWFCNDNAYPMSVPCSTFGDMADDIIQKCYAYGQSQFHFPYDEVHGQNFDSSGGWNVIVAGTKC
ncbi:hypothetical protein HD806DRAFT_175991 [Xylariaceae sp. AK1471]|nr:hypothetical protein HD806DRAFT_175991 [Xylariaceae sp. AK1471]